MKYNICPTGFFGAAFVLPGKGFFRRIFVLVFFFFSFSEVISYIKMRITDLQQEELGFGQVAAGLGHAQPPLGAPVVD